MNAPPVYLDTSAIVKRYIAEPGSDIIRDLYLRAYSGDVLISFSLWNIGEFLGAIDRAKRLNRLKEYDLVRRRFLRETMRMVKLRIASVIPIKVRILRDSWTLLEKHHIYEADALQIASAKYIESERFLTGDERLHEVAIEEGLNSVILT